MPFYYKFIYIYSSKLDSEIDFANWDSLDDSVAGDIECSDLADATVERCFDGLQDNKSFECFKFPLEKVILLLLWPRASIRMGFGMV